MLWAAEVMSKGSQRLEEPVASALGAVAAADVNEFGSVFVGCARRGIRERGQDGATIAIHRDCSLQAASGARCLVQVNQRS